MSNAMKYCAVSLGTALVLAGLALASPNTLGNILRIHNQTFASLPAAATLNEGGLLYDTTGKAAHLSNGLRWNSIPVVSSFNGISNFDATAAVEEQIFTGSTFRLSAGQTGYIENIACSWEQAGTGGTTGVVVKVFDNTSGTTVCSCTVGTCTNVAFSGMHCACNGAMTTNANRTLSIRLDSATDCTANPRRIGCTATVLGAQ